MARNLTKIWDGITASGLEGRSPEASVFARQLNGFVAAGGLFVLIASIPIAFGNASEAMPVAAGFGLFAFVFVFLVRFVPDRWLRLSGHVAGGGAICAVGIALWIEDPNELLNGFWWLAIVILPIVHLLGRVAGVGWTAVAVAILGMITIRDARAAGIGGVEATAELLAQVAFLVGVLAVGSFVRTLSVRQIAELERQRRTIRRQGTELDSVRMRAETAGANARVTAEQLETALVDRREATDAKTMLLEAVNHEIRDPLNAVLGSCTLLLDEELTPEQRELAQAIREAATALLTSVVGLVDFTRLEAGDIELEERPFRVGDVLTDVTQTVASRPDLVPFEISAVRGQGLDIEVVGDAAHLGRVLEALAEFSADLNPGCSVRVSAERDANETVRFEVTSTPLDAEHAEAIASALARIEEAQSPPEPDDIALGMARDLVCLMGGQLTARLDVEAFHAYFHVPLPRSESSIGHSTRITEQGPESALRVLLVDSSPEDRREMARQLSTWGVNCDTVDSLEAAAGREYDMTVVSVDQAHEGDIDGVVARARGFTRADGGLLLVLPRHLVPAAVDGALFVHKPVRAGDLRALVESAVRPGSAPLGHELDRARTGGNNMRHGSTGCVLVVEDNSVSAKIVCRLLERMGVPAVPLTNGLEALRYIEDHDVDAVLMDCHMPVMDGFEATRLLRRWEGKMGGHIPVIALTGRAGEDDRQRCLAAGMDDHLAKPVSPQDLAAVLARNVGDVTDRSR